MVFYALLTDFFHRTHVILFYAYTEFRKIPFIRLLNANNAQVENIAFFSDNFAWDTTIKNAHYQIDNFFNSQMRFECEHNTFEKLTELLSSL